MGFRKKKKKDMVRFTFQKCHYSFRVENALEKILTLGRSIKRLL